MAIDIDDWGYPHLLLIGLCVVLGATLVYASATSTAALGAYNPTWNGVSEVRDVADDTETTVVIGTETADYEDLSPNTTTAVLFSPDQQYTANETARIREFVTDGGTLLIAEDYGQQTTTLLQALDTPIRVNGSILRDERYYGATPAFPHARDVGTHPYTADVERLTLNRGTTLEPATARNQTALDTLATNENVTLLANSSGFAYHDTNSNEELDENESLQRRPIAATSSIGDGEVVVIADSSVFLNTMLDQSGNRQFLENIVGARETVFLDYSHSGGQPPLATLLILLRQSDLAAAIALVTIVGGWLLSGNTWVLAQLRNVVRRVTTPVRRWLGEPVTPDIDRSFVHDREELVAYLRQQHPEWDEERIDRVIAGVMPDDDATEDTSDDNVE
jgi:hypothetical protein